MGEQTVRFRPYDGYAFTITGSHHDVGVVGEIERSGGRYQHDLALLLRRRLRPEAVVVDGGAHIGVLTVLMARLCAAGRVFAFEPSPDTRRYLDGNLAANGITNVTVEGTALYDRDGDVTMDLCAAQPGGAHLAGVAPRSAPPGDPAGGGPPGGTDTVAATRLDTWAAARRLDRLDLIKLDVEGTELAVLAGAEATIRRFRPVVVVECNPVALRRFGRRSYADLLAALRDLFPTVGLIGAEGHVVPLRSVSHLEVALGDRGVVDLVGLSRRPGPVAVLAGRARARADRRRLQAVHDPGHLPTSARNLVIEPAVDIVPAVAEVNGPSAVTVSVPVSVTNRSRWWLSSSFPYVPVHLAYRLFDEAGQAVVPEGRRTAFPSPVPPGGAIDMSLDVDLPAAPGRYELLVTPVQEFYTWFDDVDPGSTARLPLVVSGP